MCDLCSAHTRIENLHQHLHGYGLKIAPTSNSAVGSHRPLYHLSLTISFFVHLVKSLGPEEYLAPISMLLVDRSITKAGRGGSTPSQAMELPQGVAAAFDVDTKLEVCLDCDVDSLIIRSSWRSWPRYRD